MHDAILVDPGFVGKPNASDVASLAITRVVYDGVLRVLSGRWV
jgi:hypothetical protein